MKKKMVCILMAGVMALVALVTGNVGQCIGLLVIYAIITVVRQYIEPKIVGNSLGVHPLVTLAGLYFGRCV